MLKCKICIYSEVVEQYNIKLLKCWDGFSVRDECNSHRNLQDFPVVNKCSVKMLKKEKQFPL